MKWLHLMIIVLFSVSTLTATTINVPADAATIQAAIDTATDGDSVLVSDGTYIENINFQAKNILVYSENGPAFTTIDGGGLGSVVSFINQEENAILDGFTVTNGRGILNDDNHYIGGGIICRNESSPTLRNLIVEGNFCTGDTSMGGGIMCSYQSDALLEDVIIRDNGADYGGGLVAFESSPTLRRVQVYDNNARTTGGGINLWESDSYLEDVLVHHNTAYYLGAGIWVHHDAYPVFNKVTVANNSCTAAAAYLRGGGGLECSDGGMPMIVNSIFWGNVPNQIEFYSRTGYADNAVTVAYSDVQGGQINIDHNGAGTVDWGLGNMDENPQFVDNYALAWTSPCLDVGVTQWVVDEVTLIDMTEDDYCGPNPDMGWCEMPLPPVTYYVPGDFSSIQAAIDGSVDSDIIMVDVGTYVENIDFNGKNVTLKSIGGPELTIIDGNANGSTVLINSGETSAVFDGFTVTNGTGTLSDTGRNLVGGGIAVRNGSTPILRNLIIEGNNALGDTAIGGGIIFSHGSDALVEDVIVRNNQADYGGGLVAFGSNPTLRRVEIYENHGRVTCGGLVFWTSSSYVEDIYVHDNTARWMAAGIWVHLDATPTLNKVTSVDNRCTNSQPIYTSAGGLGISDGSRPILVNCVLWGNFPNSIEFWENESANGVSVNYTDLEGGLGGIVTNNNGSVTWGAGNISVNPLIGNPNSPCIDAGIAELTLDGETVIDMTPDEYVGLAPDMGSFEFPEPSILNVPGDFPAIQLAIDASKDGDTVLVARGTYVENINFLGKNIGVMSVEGDSVTTIDGGGLSAVVTIANQEETAILDGFTIINGIGFLNQLGKQVGGGIAVRYSSTPTLRNLIVENNHAPGDTSMGGGISCAYGADALIEDVIIRNNSADYGGGFLAFEASPTLLRMKIHNNVARTTGAGLALWESESLVQETAIYKNQAEYLGGGVWVHEGGNPTLDRVTIADNSVVNPTSWGGAGIELSHAAHLTLMSSIVWLNAHVPEFGSNTWNQIEFYHLGGDNEITIISSDVQDGEEGITTFSNGSVNWSTTNITDGPMFVDREVDNYNLQVGSPCIGTGMMGVDMGAGTVCLALAVDPLLAVLPQEFELGQNYPNPFNPSTTISYSLPSNGWVDLMIYDVLGREVASLISAEMTRGIYKVDWTAQDQNGNPIGTGIYLYEMKFTETSGKQFREVRKFTLLK